MKRHESVDRLSELPECLILHILSFLEMRDVVKTSLLSKGWKDLWTSIPSLTFNETEKSLVQTRNFINGVILRWRGTKILRFKITFGKAYDASLSGDVDYWVGFATERKVEELYLLLPYNTWDPDPVHLPPQCLYSCSSIKRLRFVGYNFRMINNVQWDQLKDLWIDGYCIREDLVNQLVSSAPRLEILEVCLAGGRQNVNIRCSWLQALKLDIEGHDPSSLTIWAPNLTSLAVQGVFSPCLLLKVGPLTCADICLKDICDLRIEATLKQLLPATQSAESLFLSLNCYKMLGVMKSKYLFPNVKDLQLCGGPFEPYDIAIINEYFPKVERLHIVWKYKNAAALLLENLLQNRGIGEKYFETKAKNLKLKFKPILMQLRTLDLSWDDGDGVSMFLFIKCLLKQARKQATWKQATRLPTIVIRKRGDGVVQSEVMFLAAQELVNLQRSFPYIDVFFCKK